MCWHCQPVHLRDINTIDTCVQVREVRGRLLSYWRRQVLVEAAAEVFPPTSSARGPPHIRATLNNRVGKAQQHRVGSECWVADALP
jgi:hypothetical protein